MGQIQLTEDQFNELKKEIAAELRLSSRNTSEMQAAFSDLIGKYRPRLQKATSCGTAFNYIRRAALFLNGYSQTKWVLKEDVPAVKETAEKLCNEILKAFEDKAGE